MNDSQFLGVSIRGWLAILLTVTACLMSSFGMKVEEPLYSGFLMALGFYLGQKTQQKTPGEPGA